MLGKRGKTPNDILVGVAGFEPATPASRTIRRGTNSLINLKSTLRKDEDLISERLTPFLLFAYRSATDSISILCLSGNGLTSQIGYDGCHFKPTLKSPNSCCSFPAMLMHLS